MFYDTHPESWNSVRSREMSHIFTEDTRLVTTSYRGRQDTTGLDEMQLQLQRCYSMVTVSCPVPSYTVGLVDIANFWWEI